MEFRTHLSRADRWVLVLGGALALAVFPAGSAAAQAIFVGPAPGGVPVVVTAVGTDGGVPVSQPFGEGFTEVSAVSSNSGVVQVNQVEKPKGGGVSFAVQGVGVGIVTITWTNPARNETREVYYIVSSGVTVDQAEAMTLSPGQQMLINLPTVVSANAYVGNTQFPTNAVVSPAVQVPGGVQVTANTVGTSFVMIQLPNDTGGVAHYRIEIVHVIRTGEYPTIF